MTDLETTELKRAKAELRNADRRDFLKAALGVTGAVALAPVLGACGGSGQAASQNANDAIDNIQQAADNLGSAADNSANAAIETGDNVVQGTQNAGNNIENAADQAAANAQDSVEQMAAGLPTTQPDDWDPIAFNRNRGNLGAIPESYRETIAGEGGEQAIGKHLPYAPDINVERLPDGYCAIMFGDEEAGYPKHPNAGISDEDPDGHFYNWIRIRKAEENATELQSTFSGWPALAESDNGKYGAMTLGTQNGNAPAANGGRETVYFCQLPEGVSHGDTIRIHAHCISHGEYVHFVTLPAH